MKLNENNKNLCDRRNINILISAYSCLPNSVSEPGVAWLQIESLIKKNKYNFIIVTRKKNVEAITRHIKKISEMNNEVVGVDLPKYLLIWKKGHLSMHIYYYIWQILAFFACKKIMKKTNINLVHHLSFMSLRTNMAPFLGIPSIMGPVGGGQLPPVGFNKVLRHPIKEKLRNISLYMMKYSPFWRAFIKRFSIVLLANSDNIWLFPKELKNYKLQQIGWPVKNNDEKAKVAIRGEIVKSIYWGGRLIGWKGLEILIRALPLLDELKEIYHVNVTGKGPEYDYYIELTRKLDVQNNITFHGWVDDVKKEKLQEESDICIFTSLHETTGTALMEMMAHAKPIVVLNHAGPGEIINADSGFRVSVDFGVEKAVNDMAFFIKKLLLDDELRRNYGDGAKIRLETKYNWSIYINNIEAIYDELICN